MARRLLGVSALCASFVLLCVAAPAPGQATVVTQEKVPPGKYTGKLLSLPSAEGAFTLEITSQLMEPKANAVALLEAYTKFQTDYQNGIASYQREIAAGRDVAGNQRRLQDHVNWYQRNAAAYQPGGSHFPYQVKNVTQTVELQAAPDVKIRLAEPPPIFDDKGRVRKPTAAERVKLKGKDTSLTGYEASKDDLATGLTVRVTVGRAKPPSKRDKSSPAAATAGKKLVNLIVILNKDAGVGTNTLNAK